MGILGDCGGMLWLLGDFGVLGIGHRAEGVAVGWFLLLSGSFGELRRMGWGGVGWACFCLHSNPQYSSQTGPN